MIYSGRNPNNNNVCNTLPLWRDVPSNNDHHVSSSLPLYYSFSTDHKQCLATSHMSSKGHCCLCQFTAIDNDLDVLIKHLSYCHPRFTASLKVIEDSLNKKCPRNSLVSNRSVLGIDQFRSDLRTVTVLVKYFGEPLLSCWHSKLNFGRKQK